MARKKSSQKQTTKQFSNSPFTHLKGLSAFEPQPQPARPPKTPAAGAGQSPVMEDRGSFAEEMDLLGVKPLPGCTIEPDDGRKLPPSPPRKSRQESDEALFLEALGSMEKTFKDEWPGEEVEKQAAPRRMKQVEKGQLVPDDELDLHGLTVEAATEKTLFFLQNAIYQGHRTVLLITGKGLHSADAPVLRQAVERLLREQPEQVMEHGVAPGRYGGDGALVVFLRSRREG